MIKKIKIVADDKIPFLKGALEAYADIHYYPGSEINSEIVKDADALIVRTRTICNSDLLEGSSVKFIATATIGFDHIDTEYCNLKNISWTNAPGCNSSSVEQYISSALSELAHRKNVNLPDLCIGVVGIGMVGSKVARLATLLGMKVLKNDPPRARKESQLDFVSLEEIQNEADIISFHVPLNCDGPDMTLNMADIDFFSKIKKGTIIINSSRGQVIDEAALKQALTSGQVSAAVLDVWENEPCIDNDLLKLTEIATPHIAGYSTDGKANGTMLSVRAVSAFFGLGLDDWEPENIPPPLNFEIILDCTGMDPKDIIREVFLNTYDINIDDIKLRESPEKFEEFRNCYPIRREGVAYSLQLINNMYPHLEDVFEQLGYQVLEMNCF